MSMMFRIALIVSLALSPVPANAAELACTGESGPLLTVGSMGADRIGLVQGGQRQELQLERWSICFRCVGFPRLDLTFKDAGARKTDVRLFADARACDGGATAPERYCIAAAGVRVGDKDTQKCRFPDGTSLASLWTALTQSQPPENTEPWWSYPER